MTDVTQIIEDIPTLHYSSQSDSLHCAHVILKKILKKVFWCVFGLIKKKKKVLNSERVLK